MAITFGAEGHNAKGTSDTGALTIALTVPSGILNGYSDMFVHLIGAPTQTVSTCTFDGTGMTWVSRNTATGDNFITVEHWRMVHGDNPATGSKNIVITPSAACRMIGYVAMRAGVHQTTPNNGSDSFAEGNSSTITQNVSAATGELVVDGACTSGARTFAAGGGQTERTNYTPSDNVVGSEEDGAGTVTMSWAVTGGADIWVSLAWRLNPAPTDPASAKWIAINTERRPRAYAPGRAR